METPAAWIRLAFAVVMLVGASALDLRERRVRNPYWFPYLSVAAVFLVVDYALWGLSDDFLWAWGVAAASCALFYLLWYVGFLFGGADAKGLMVLALLVPAVPGDLATRITPAVDTLLNGVLLTLALPLGLLLLNLARGRFGGLATLLAVPMPLEEARDAFVWPLERVRPDGTVRRRHVQRRGEDLDAVYAELAAVGVTTVWATPKVPFMVPMTLGLGAALLWGNLLLRIMATAVGR